MEINLICISKTDDKYLEDGIKKYEDRIRKYSNYNKIVIPGLKSYRGLSFSQIKEAEGEILKKYMRSTDYNILLDENGKEFSSIDFSAYLEGLFLNSYKRINFIIGGAYGFSSDIYGIANQKISLSKMTFSHQIIRIIFLEQLYRAFTIIKGEPYHHQ